jgi:hypothetical protein
VIGVSDTNESTKRVVVAYAVLGFALLSVF